MQQPDRPSLQGLRGSLLVCGTASDVGKSRIVTGLCRLLARGGVRVAPFKAQNMSLNAWATVSGHEIGHAQGVQAVAAGVEPEVAMNPVLLKPTSDSRCQVVVLGRPVAELDAAAYESVKAEGLMATVLGAFEELKGRFDVVVCEGAGGAAEINLLERDLANLPFAAEAGVPALLVGDIERGGVFAALYGTVELLPEALRRQVRGFVVNKFRGEVALLQPGLDELEARSGLPILGVLPYLDDLGLDAEDSLGLAATVRAPGTGATLDVAVVAYPHLANFTDLDALACEPAVALRLVRSPGQLGDPDLLLLPGSKATVTDLAWLRSSGLAEAVVAAAARSEGPTVLGVCAGYQMLGSDIVDEVESGEGQVGALGVLPVGTAFEPGKLARRRRGTALGEAVSGYEIRHGRPIPADGAEAFAHLDDDLGAEVDGVAAEGGRLAGTNLHGLFESDAFRGAYLAAVAARRGKHFEPGEIGFHEARERQIDRLADLLEAHLDVPAVLRLIAGASP